MQIEWLKVEEEIENRVHIACIPKRDATALKIARILVGSGAQDDVWWHRESAGTLVVGYSTNCAHDYDCCGCLFGVSYTITGSGRYWTIISESKYNY